MKVLKIIVSIIFLITGGFVLNSIIRGMLGFDELIGLFLWKSYSYMALGIPLLFFWLFVELFSKKTILYKVFCPALMVAPLLAFSIALRIMFWNPTQTHPPFWITTQLLGNTVAMVFWFFIGSLLLFTIAVFYTVWVNAISKEKTVQTEIQNIKHSLSNNYTKITQFLKKIQTQPAPSMQQTQPSNTQTQVDQIQKKSTYSTIDVSSHSKNHSASQYVPETSITPTHQDRYLLIFDKNKLKNNTKIKLYQELATEGVQDYVPLGAEGYVTPHDEINKYTKINFEKKNDFYINNSSTIGNPVSSETNDEYNKYQTIQSNEFDVLDKNKTHILEIDKYNYIENKDFSTFNSDEQNESLTDNTIKNFQNDNNDSNAYLDYSTYKSTDTEDYVTDSFTPESKLENTLEYNNNNPNGSFVQDYTENKRKEKAENIFQTSEQENSTKKKIPLTQKLEKSLKNKIPYRIPIHGILKTPITEKLNNPEEAQLIGLELEKTLKDFNIEARVLSFSRGPVVTLFEILPAPGVRLSRIVSLADNIALQLAATSVRIVAPIPGKGAVGIEVPNVHRTMVSLSELITHKAFFNKENILPIALGRDVSNNVKVSDLSRTPHLLIAGATGSGKSVCINSIICSLLFKCSPDELKFLLIDPKMVELNFYNDIPHLLTPVIDDPEKSIKILRWCIEEMERRYRILNAYGAREIRSYNSKLASKNVPKAARMPYIVIIIDEFADLMLTCGKELEMLVSRIAAKSRAVGMHLVLATQRPSTDVITGVIKANIPSRIAFMVSSKTDSRIIIDQNGADTLLGKGDMLLSSTQDLSPIRIQGAFLSENEVINVVNKVKEIGGEPDYLDEEELFPNEKNSVNNSSASDDPLWDDAISIIKENNKASASHLQRYFKIGYNRAARLIDEMEHKGIIGPQLGSKSRDVFI